MSSASIDGYISSRDLAMLQSVLDNAGFTHQALVSDECRFSAAALLVMELFQNGMTAPADLLAELVFYFGVQKTPVTSRLSTLPQYAIQGMPPASSTTH